MLKPITEYKDQIVQMLSDSPEKTKQAFGSLIPATVIFNDSTVTYVSVDNNNNIIGLFNYKILPTAKDSQEYGAC
jgi:hypothetical protein